MCKSTGGYSRVLSETERTSYSSESHPRDVLSRGNYWWQVIQVDTVVSLQKTDEIVKECAPGAAEAYLQ